MDFFKKMHDERNKTIVIVTHDQNLVKYAKKVIYLRDGVVEKTHDST
jgi:putative ABC transport system ATP-binding protein